MLDKLMVPSSKLFTLESGTKKEDVMVAFKETDYDIIPINGNPISMYYHKESSKTNKINFDNTIDVNMSIKSLLKKFNDQHYTFVTENGVVVGLLTIADLNSKEFSLWLYKYFIDIEKELCLFARIILRI